MNFELREICSFVNVALPEVFEREESGIEWSGESPAERGMRNYLTRTIFELFKLQNDDPDLINSESYVWYYFGV